jgi:hypothetical protein
MIHKICIGSSVRRDPAGITLEIGFEPFASFGPLSTKLRVDGTEYRLHNSVTDSGRTEELGADNCPVSIQRTWTTLPDGFRISHSLCNLTGRDVILNSVELLGLPDELAVDFGARAESWRVLEQGAYWGRVDPMFRGMESIEGSSDLVWMATDSDTGHAALFGFETSDRWHGRVQTTRGPERKLTRFSLWLDGGDTLIPASATIPLEDVLVLASDDPLDLLDVYGQLVHDRHRPDILQESPVTWCSWYPYRLGVSHERIVANAKIAAERLRPLGMQTMLVDLGWERDWLPSAFEENENFPYGLAGVADELAKLGLNLGVWAGPTSISEHSDMRVDHPEWLVAGDDGKPYEAGVWFWEPHGQTHILDLTHPGAQEWLRDRMRSLALRGCSYFKGDFVGNIASDVARNRHDNSIVGGGGLESGRIAARILRDTIREHHPQGMLLSCGGPEMPGTSFADLIYTCNDTGNTGYVGWELLREQQLAIATHLFKHRKWGVIQPSCTTIGLPGTLDEARARATVTFMSGGQYDSGDDLTRLPEERWRVLTASLPPYGVAARPIDLFQPIKRLRGSYSASTQTAGFEHEDAPDAPPASVWTLPVHTGWDSWTLVALFSYDIPSNEASHNEALLDTFQIPIERLGMDPDADIWSYEFWSGQFCGCLPADPPPRPDYSHPGDVNTWMRRDETANLAVSFFGPGVRLFALRERRVHPWVVGTSFHQSCGLELSDVVWNEANATLSGRLNRPAGENGNIVVAGFRGQDVRANFDGRDAFVREDALGSGTVSVTIPNDSAEWEFRLR